MFDTVGHTLVAGRLGSLDRREPGRRGTHGLATSRSTASPSPLGRTPGAWAMSVCRACATTARVNAPISIHTPPTRIARSVIVVVLSFLDAARSSAEPGTNPSMSKRPNRVSSAAWTNLEQRGAVRQGFLTDRPGEMSNRTDGSTNAASCAVGSSGGSWGCASRVGRCRRVRSASFVLATGRFVKSWRRVRRRLTAE